MNRHFALPNRNRKWPTNTAAQNRNRGNSLLMLENEPFGAQRAPLPRLQWWSERCRRQQQKPAEAPDALGNPGLFSILLGQIGKLLKNPQVRHPAVPQGKHKLMNPLAMLHNVASGFE